MDKNTPITFGKYIGTPVGQLPPGYLLWMFEQEWLHRKYPGLHRYIKKRLWYLREAQAEAEELRLLSCEAFGCWEWWKD